MTDNRTTELREKLDALGVEHYDTEHMTEWHDVRGLKWNYFSDGENTDLTLETPWEGCTPGQAVAATLGRPTWRNSYDQQRYDQWYDSLFHGEPSSFKELIEDVIWTTETVDLGPNGNECQGVDEGEVNTERPIESWAKRAATPGSERERMLEKLVQRALDECWCDGWWCEEARELGLEANY